MNESIEINEISKIPISHTKKIPCLEVTPVGNPHWVFQYQPVIDSHTPSRYVPADAGRSTSASRSTTGWNFLQYHRSPHVLVTLKFIKHSFHLIFQPVLLEYSMIAQTMSTAMRGTSLKVKTSSSKAPRGMSLKTTAIFKKSAPPAKVCDM
jgi:hypothetical protein